MTVVSHEAADAVDLEDVPRSMPWRVAGWLLHRPGIVRLLVILGAIALWEILARAFGDPLFVAAPSQVFMGLDALLRTRGVPMALLVTAGELGLAFVLSAVFGIAIGVAVGINGYARRSFMPIILLLYATPQVTIMPIFMMVFGIGPASKVAYGFSHGIFPILVTVAAGVQNVKPALVLSAKSMGASRGQILRHIVFPHAIPSLFTGLRLGMTATLLGVILAELYVSVTGVGFFSRKFAESFQPVALFGLIALVAMIAILVNELLRRLELRLAAWRGA